MTFSRGARKSEIKVVRVLVLAAAILVTGSAIGSTREVAHTIITRKTNPQQPTSALHPDDPFGTPIQGIHFPHLPFVGGWQVPEQQSQLNSHLIFHCCNEKRFKGKMV
jgi:hypothetical protein